MAFRRSWKAFWTSSEKTSFFSLFNLYSLVIICPSSIFSSLKESGSHPSKVIYPFSKAIPPKFFSSNPGLSKQ
jgi:hypothetical protein